MSSIKNQGSSNPYAPRKIALAATGTPAAGNARVPAGRINPRTGSVVESHTEALIGADGHLNASTKADVMQAMTVLQRHFDSGKAKRATARSQEERATTQQRLVEAFHANDNGRSWLAIGEVMGEEVWMTLGRDGFTRKTLMIKNLAKGEIGRLKVRRKDVSAFMAVAPHQVQSSNVRQFYVFPPEFYLTCSILIDDREIEQATGDLLDEKYQDGLEQILVKEDQTWLTLARAAAASANDLFMFNTLTPAVFSEMQIQISSWGIPAASAIVAFDLWNDIRTDSEFASYFDPVTKHELIMEGSLGSIFGVQLITDAFRDQALRVLDNGEMYMLGAPETLGGITIRKDLMTKNVDKYSQELPQRGWFMEAIEGMAIVNPRALIRGVRV